MTGPTLSRELAAAARRGLALACAALPAAPAWGQTFPAPLLAAPMKQATPSVAGDPPAKQGDNGEKETGPKATGSNEASQSYVTRNAPAGPPMTLADCLAVALEQQPAVRAADHSLAAAHKGLTALENISPLAARLSPDLPVRKKQAASGIAVSQAEVRKVRNEVVYDVTRLYWTFVYATQQLQTANDVVEQMENFYNVAEEIVKSGVRDPKIRINQFTLYTLQDALGEVRKLRVNAVSGRNSALAALKEAMGVPPELMFVPRDTELPIMAGDISRDEVIALALSRRPELAQAAAGVDAFRLEVCAQAQVRFRQTVPTLASGSDLHSRPVPLPNRNGDYKPGAVPPEMPVMLVGKTEDRVARAAEYSLRQEDVYEKTVGLVRLEAINTFLGYEATTERLREAKRKFDNSRRLVEESRTAAATRQDPELLLRNEAMAGKAQAEYLEAAFEQIKTLATLERVTAGGVRPAFPGR